MKKLALDYLGDSHPASQPQYAEDHPEQPEIVQPETEYNWVWCNGQLEISPHHEHDELAQHAGVGNDFVGPFAVGSMHLNMGQAIWEVDTNTSVGALVKVLKDYCKQIGWKWGGITDTQGEPIGQGSAYGPVKSFVYSFVDDHLYIASSEHRLGSQRAVMGYIEVENGVATASGPREAREAITEWAEDEGYKVAGDFNLKTRPDLELFNNSDPNPTAPQDHQYFNQAEEKPLHERGQGGVYACPKCGRLIPNWTEYMLHYEAHGPDMPHEEPHQDSGMKSMDELGSNIMEQEDGTTTAAIVIPVTRSVYAAFRDGEPVGYIKLNDGLISHVQGDAQLQLWDTVSRYAAKEPKDMIEGPIPFIYDVKNDDVVTGQPNQRSSDIHGAFTPGGIVEGTYEPGGKVYIRTSTNYSYTVRHMIELFYAKLPQLEVKSVFLMQDDGKKLKLASDKNDVGTYVKSLVASDPVAHNACRALEHAGGNVYAVGGAVRDAVMGREPKDIDLMVAGLPAEHVKEVLEKLPGRVDLTGKDFGVYRYKNGKNDVEIALPRRERSTGDKHTDFSVQADHTMNVDDDLLRRDFTANALAVSLRDGHLVDPFGGANDIRGKTLRTITKSSLADDPLRIVRGLVANSRFGFSPDANTREQISNNVHKLVHLPAERIHAELDKLMSADDPASAIRLAHETGALQYLLPEVDRAMGYNQNNPHHELDLGTHLLNVLDRTASQTKDPDVRMAALLHDIGKPDSAWVDPVTGSNHYYQNELGQGADHEKVGADMAELRLKQLKYPNARVDRIKNLVAGHMFPNFTTSKGARRFIQKWGDHADDLFTLRWADQGGKDEAGWDPTSNITPMKALVEKAREEPTSQADLAISGHDLIAMGIPAGPEMGSILRSLTEAVVSDPSLNTKEHLSEMAQSMIG